ncbi:HSP20 family molecular chaperone IbpA [Arcicella aurantiaca]|uniref:HSP20 family molecular chaperone IbpA n=1 Tax=Arcicella aurantiaca TaxID=591202 RepID=A0A316EBK2_9BACT|nr:Hsp20/alpha crystallin family protein [Arcicella aurantiaca]PWK26693.1 HSP20 family molecular chaperone IbpA [Arcicella aurantiaca]
MENKKIVIPRDILANIDFNNTLNGGRVEPNIQVNQTENAYEVFVKVAGLAADHLKVDIEENRLLLYALQPVLKTAEQEVPENYVPQTIGQIMLPNFVDLENISARYHNHQWKIVMPFDDNRKGFKRNVEVEF